VQGGIGVGGVEIVATGEPDVEVTLRQLVEPEEPIETFSYLADPSTGEGQRHHSEVPAREGDLVFGGSDTSFGWNGWMEGALETGGRAAAEVLDVLQKADGNG
jgi:hypothetical protein